MNDEIESLIKGVRQVAYGLHVYRGDGLLEKVYENGLRHRLERAGFCVEAQKPLTVYDDDGVVLGAYFADLVVNGCLLVELHVKSSSPLFRRGERAERGDPGASSPRSPDLHVNNSFALSNSTPLHGSTMSSRSPDLHG